MSAHGERTAQVPASPTAGYGVCSSADYGEPVTLFTARQGLNLTMGDAERNEDKHRGTLVRPVERRKGGVVWLMDLREPGQAEARQVRLLVGPRTAKPLLPKGVDPDPKLWASPKWVSRDGAGQGVEGTVCNLGMCATGMWDQGRG